MRRVIERCAFRIGLALLTEQTEDPTYRTPFLSVIFRLLEVQLVDDSQCEGVGYKNLCLCLKNHILFQSVGRSIRTIGLQAKRADGIFLDLDLTNGFVAPRRDCESQESEQETSCYAAIDNPPASPQHHPYFSERKLGC